MSLVRSPRALAGASLGLLLGTAVALSLAAPANADPLPLPSLPSLPSIPSSLPSAPSSLPSIPELLPVTCTVTVSTPQVISIGSARPSIAMALSRSGCDLALIGSGTDVTLASPTGAATTYTFTDPSKATSRVVPAAAGIFASGNGHAGFYNLNNVNLTVQWKYSSTRAKFQTRSALSTIRKGRTLTMGGFVKYYSAAQNTFVGTAGRVVQLEKLTSRGWEPIRTVRSDARGAVHATYTSSTAGQYRWSSAETYGTWSTTSAARRV